MRMNGELYWSIGTDAKGTVKAAITQKRISIDWKEGDVVGHLEAISRDGENFTGHYGYSPEANPDMEFKLTLFRNKSETLLVGTWCEHNSGDEGTWFFRLNAEQTQGNSKGRKRAKS